MPLRRARFAGLVFLLTSSVVSASETTRVIVLLRQPEPWQAAERSFAAAREESLTRLVTESGGRMERYWRNLSAFAAEVTPEGLRRLESDPAVERVDRDEGGSGGLRESLPLIGVSAAADRGYTGRGVVVAVLDSGIDASHPDLQGKVIEEQCFCRRSDGTGCCPNGQTSQSGAGAGADDHGHGTNVSGIIASSGTVAPRGVAPDVRLISVKVLDSGNRFSGSAQVISGLDWLLERHPEVRVVNMSLLTDATFSGACDGGPSFAQAFSRAIAALRQRGALVFACSGNDGMTNVLPAPACVQNAVSVGAVYDANFGSRSGSCTDATTAADQITCFSNSSATLDLLAPGSVITSAGRGGGTSSFSGTSQAAPHAAGAAALLMEVAPALDAAGVESILKVTGKSLRDGRNGVIAPRIDVGAAVRLLLEPRPRRRSASR